MVVEAYNKAKGEDKGDLESKEIVLINLKNGMNLKGVILSRNGKELTVDIGGGSVGVPVRDVVNIEALAGEARTKVLDEMTGSLEKDKKGVRRTEIRYGDPDRITVGALLNGTSRVDLILDTGSPYVVLTPATAQRVLNIDKAISKAVKMGWTDGSVTQGRMVLLDSVVVGGIEANNVKAVISEVSVLDPGTEGLLGMSFLNNFHIKMDSGRKVVILERKR
ncbi:MAG: retropepsin-like aspartic protease [Candidatus Omnitrophica bacterium]|nr:retropepsin-like aspartic protease [Candidatus Omnitrophota bacterium]MDD5488577.1 retropepsin-like aspartic protease [Candidatus Omnitrophota bacterium]